MLQHTKPKKKYAPLRWCNVVAVETVSHHGDMHSSDQLRLQLDLTI